MRNRTALPQGRSRTDPLGTRGRFGPTPFDSGLRFPAGRIRLPLRMTPSRIELYSLQIETPVQRVRPLNHEDIQKFSDWLCDPEGFRLRPDQVKLKAWDQLFGYEIIAQFFGENGFLVRTPDRVRVGVKNARTSADWDIIQQVFVRFLQQESPPENAFRTFSASAHVKLDEPVTASEFLNRFAVVPGIEKPAALSYVKIADWEKEIRIVIEPSNLFPGQLFLTWDSQFEASQDWDTFVPALMTVMENSARIFDLGLAPLR
jgi:hypothetical protein